MRSELPLPAKPDVTLPSPYPVPCQRALPGLWCVEATRALQSPCAAAGSPTGHFHAQNRKESFNPDRLRVGDNLWVFL